MKLVTFTLNIVCIIVILFNACDLGQGAINGAFLRIDKEQCIGCRECVKVCNSDAIIMISNKAVIDLSKCVECLKCIETCPVDAIE